MFCAQRCPALMFSGTETLTGTENTPKNVNGYRVKKDLLTSREMFKTILRGIPYFFRDLGVFETTFLLIILSF